MRKLVSVIIVSWNGGRVLEDCLESLAKLDYPRWELIFVDNGSEDNSLDLVEDWEGGRRCERKLVIRNTRNLGFARANNQGWEKAKGEYVLLLNNDTKVERNFLTGLVERMEEEPDLGVVQPKIVMMDSPGYLDNAGSFLTWIGFLYHWGFGQKDGKEFGSECEIFSAKGACMLIRREIIEKVGLFDSDFVSYFEESDFCWRVWLSGYRVLFFPAAKIYHKVGFTIRRLDVWGNNYHCYKNRICALLKNLEMRNLVWMLPVHLAVSLGIVGAFLAKGQVKNSAMIMKAWWWNLRNFSVTLRKRKGVQQRREVSDGELFKKLMHRVNWGDYFKDFERVEEDLRRKVELS